MAQAARLRLADRCDKFDRQNQFRRLRRSAGLAMDARVYQRACAIKSGLVQGSVATRQDLDSEPSVAGADVSCSARL